MKNNRSEHLANLALGEPVKVSPLCKVGKNFVKPGKKRVYNRASLLERIRGIKW